MAFMRRAIRRIPRRAFSARRPIRYNFTRPTRRLPFSRPSYGRIRQ